MTPVLLGLQELHLHLRRPMEETMRIEAIHAREILDSRGNSVHVNGAPKIDGVLRVHAAVEDVR